MHIVFLPDCNFTFHLNVFFSRHVFLFGGDSDSGITIIIVSLMPRDCKQQTFEHHGPVIVFQSYMASVPWSVY